MRNWWDTPDGIVTAEDIMPEVERPQSRSEFCGVSVAGEEGYCRTHLAELWGQAKHKIHYMIKSGRLEAWEAREQLSCGRKRSGDCLIHMGRILDFDSHGVEVER